MAVPFSVDVVTLSPAAVVSALTDGLVGRAIRQGRVRLRVWQLREFSRDPHRKVDDVPYGGGRGMVLMAEPMVLAAEHALEAARTPLAGAGLSPGATLTAFGEGGDEADGSAAAGRPAVVLLSASGEPFTQQLALELASASGLVVLCGRYEGVDARVAPALRAREVSLGEFVLSSGEPAACCLIDAVVRLLPGAVGHPHSVVEESFGPAGTPTAGLLEYPQYTRPRTFRGMAVPEVLLSGHHAAVARWRRDQSLRLTWQRRPQLLQHASLTAEERRLVERWAQRTALERKAPEQRGSQHAAVEPQASAETASEPTARPSTPPGPLSETGAP